MLVYRELGRVEGRWRESEKCRMSRSCGPEKLARPAQSRVRLAICKKVDRYSTRVCERCEVVVVCDEMAVMRERVLLMMAQTMGWNEGGDEGNWEEADRGASAGRATKVGEA